MSGGLSISKAPERWEASWENNLAAAQLADAAGLEFLLPIGRWHGYRGETDTEGTSFETLTWASGLLAATEGISVFGTLHVALVNPIFAAKQIVTADHIGKGRFGLNIVSGWNEGEFDMFGVALKPHDERYDYTGEWVEIVKRVWRETEPFDFAGRHFKLKGVLGKPKPYGGDRPLLISAGNSKEGRDFAARHADCLFMTVIEARHAGGRDRRRPLIAGDRAGRYLCQRSSDLPSQPDRGGGILSSSRLRDGRLGSRRACRDHPHQGTRDTFEKLKRLKERLISGVGTFPVVGSYDDVAASFQRMSDAGLDGMAIGLVNYVQDFPQCAMKCCRAWRAPGCASRCGRPRPRPSNE